MAAEQDIRQTLKGVEIFCDLNAEEIEELKDICQTITYEKNAEIFHEKSTESDLYVLLEGRVQVIAELSKTEKAVLHTVLEGKLFGEFAFVDEAPRSATALAVEKSTVLKIPRNGMVHVFEKHPRIGYHVLFRLSRIFARRIRQTAHELKVSLMWERH